MSATSLLKKETTMVYLKFTLRSLMMMVCVWCCQQITTEWKFPANPVPSHSTCIGEEHLQATSPAQQTPVAHQSLQDLAGRSTKMRDKGPMDRADIANWRCQKNVSSYELVGIPFIVHASVLTKFSQTLANHVFTKNRNSANSPRSSDFTTLCGFFLCVSIRCTTLDQWSNPNAFCWTFCGTGGASWEDHGCSNSCGSARSAVTVRPARRRPHSTAATWKSYRWLLKRVALGLFVCLKETNYMFDLNAILRFTRL